MPGPTPNQISNLQFQNNLVLNGLDSPDKTGLVYDLSNGYNVLDTLISMLNKGKSVQTSGLNGVHQKPIMGTGNRVTQIASNALVGVNLQLNFSDVTYDLFRLGDVIIDGSASNIQGRVISKGPGFVQLEPHPAQGAWNTALHFVAGTFAKAGWDASGNRGSTGKSTLYQFPSYLTDRTGVIRDSLQLFRRDMTQTYPTFHGDFWYTAQDQKLVENYARAFEYRAWFSRPGVTANSSYEGDVNYTMGLKAAVQATDGRGGIYRSLTNPMTRTDFENFLADVANQQSSSKVELTLIMGRGALRQLQSFTSDFIQFAGSDNTFGGATVEGIDVKQFAVAGVTCKYVLAPVLNDPSFFSEPSTIPGVLGTRMSNTIVALDMGMYQSVDGVSLPAMEKIYFGDKEIIYGYVPGLIGNGQVNQSNVFTSGNMFATSGIDACTLHLYSDCGVSIVANRMGWLELAS